MKIAKLLKKLDNSVDRLYDSIYAIRDVLDGVEDEEIDFHINGFIDQLELSITEGEVNIEILRDQISELEE